MMMSSSVSLSEYYGGEMPRGVFRTLPNMYDDVLAKILQTLIIFTGA